MAGAKDKDDKGRGFKLPAEENNLVEFPLCSLADTVPSDLKTLVFEDILWDSSTKSQIPRKVTVTAGDLYGLPNWWDQDVLLALMVLTFEQNGFRDREVGFSIYELTKLLDFPDTGQTYKRVILSLDRWCATTIKFENAWRESGAWVNETFHILDNVRLTNSRDFDRDRDQVFRWNQNVVESIQAKNTKRFDWEFYRSLKNPTSKRLYRFLDKRFWHKRKWDFDGVSFAKNKIGIADGQETHRYKQQLKTGCKELVARGFIGEPKFEKSGKGSFRVTFEKPKREARKANAPVPKPRSELEQALRVRGVPNGKKLIALRGEDHIKRQIENFDHRKSQGDEVGAGWLGSACASEEGYGYRKDYESKEERAARKRKNEELTRQSEAARQKKENLRREAEEADKAKVESYLKNLTSESEREAIKREALAESSFAAKKYYDAESKGRDGSVWLNSALRQHVLKKLSATS